MRDDMMERVCWVCVVCVMSVCCLCLCVVGRAAAAAWRFRSEASCGILGSQYLNDVFMFSADYRPRTADGVLGGASGVLPGCLQSQNRPTLDLLNSEQCFTINVQIT